MKKIQGIEVAINTLKWAAKTVPAYKEFLKKNNFQLKNIKTIDDFSAVPLMDKDNYIKAYPYFDLFPLSRVPSVISSSSGSSGTPFYWARGREQESAGGILHESIFRDIFKIEKKRTLVVNCFSAGTWIAGAFTTESCRHLAETKGYNISVIPPGIEKEDILSILKKLAPLFEVVVIAGYPPFLMDVVTEASSRDIPLKNMNIKFIFAGENFSEKWRQVICDIAYIKDIEHSVASIYGTADAAMLGHETPLSIFIRQKANENKALFKDLFGDLTFLPTLVQYQPNHIYFENINNEIVFTVKGGIPLVRYNIRDRGRIFSHAEIRAILKKYSYDKEISSELKKWVMPLVSLHGRNDVSVTFYALNMFPENFKYGLEDTRISEYVTGKFIVSSKTTSDQKTQELHLSIELSPNNNKKTVPVSVIEKIVVERLRSSNTEYRKLHDTLGKKAIPKIKLLPYSDPVFTLKKIKHSWIKKEI